jgi:hypothetical protein
MLGRQYVRWRCPLVCACLWLSQSPSVQAARANGSDSQVREAVRHAVELEHPDADVDRLRVLERDDLERELSHIAGKMARPISFYSLHDIDSASDDGSLWVVVSRDSPQGSDELYSFENTDGTEQSTEKFNRLLTHLILSIPNEKATSIAQLFLSCCVRGSLGETVIDEEGLRYSVGRFYSRIYGDVWRALEAYTQWWEGYEKAAVHLTPTVVVEGGVRRIILKRVLLTFGMHPQLQRWEVAVSSDGSVSVLTVEPIFPKKTRWLSHAFRSTIEPQIH